MVADLILQNPPPMHGADRAHQNIFHNDLLFRRLSDSPITWSVSFLFNISHITCTSSYSHAFTSRPSFTSPNSFQNSQSFIHYSISQLLDQQKKEPIRSEFQFHRLISNTQSFLYISLRLELRIRIAYILQQSNQKELID